MTRAEAIQILDNHSIEFRVCGDWFQVLECSTLNGELQAEWIPCPTSRKALAFWLGY